MPGEQKLKVAILIISDTAARDPSTDKATAELRNVLEPKGANVTAFQVADTKIVPDNVIDIQTSITQWTDGNTGINLVITSGGTGFAQKDNTPEAVAPLLHKHASGLVHGMLSSSMANTPFAVMSRPVAGSRHSSIIITVPGSPKGARENLEAVAKLLPHAIIQLTQKDSRALHAGGVKRLEKDHGVRAKAPELKTDIRSKDSRILSRYSNSHFTMQSPTSHIHRHHDHHLMPIAKTDPSKQVRSNSIFEGPSDRHRKSPFPMISVEEALEYISEQTPPATSRITTVPVDLSLVGHVLSSDVHAAESVPAFNASLVDGYAVTCPNQGRNARGTFPVVYAVQAQRSGESMPYLKDGQIARITTGAPLPPGAQAVVMVEDTAVRRKTADGREEREIEILTDQVQSGENIRRVGSDVEAGDMVMQAGEQISAIGGEFGLLASVGVGEVSVYKKPIIGVLSTGDEIVPHDRAEPLRLGEVRDANRPALLTAAKGAGFEVVDLGIARDKASKLESMLRRGLSKVDVLITSGGVSMGEHDLLKPTIEQTLGGTIHFGRVSMKPGKPTTFATVPTANISIDSLVRSDTTKSQVPKNILSNGLAPDTVGNTKIIFSLPGNPASAITTFMLFVLPSLHRMSGVEPPGLPTASVRIDGDFSCDKSREEYHRVTVETREGEGGEGGSLWATSTGGQRSSKIGSFKGANALVKLPAGGGVVRYGERVDALLFC